MIEERMWHHISDLKNDLHLLTQAINNARAIHNSTENHEWEPVYRILSGMRWAVERLEDYEEVLKS